MPQGYSPANVPVYVPAFAYLENNKSAFMRVVARFFSELVRLRAPSQKCTKMHINAVISGSQRRIVVYAPLLAVGGRGRFAIHHRWRSRQRAPIFLYPTFSSVDGLVLAFAPLNKLTLALRHKHVADAYC